MHSVRVDTEGAHTTEFDARFVSGGSSGPLKTAIDLRTKNVENLVRNPIVELVNDQWAITAYGVESIERPLRFSFTRFDYATSIAQTDKNRQRVNQTKFRDALKLAADLRVARGPTNLSSSNYVISPLPCASLRSPTGIAGDKTALPLPTAVSDFVTIRVCRLL